MPYYEDITAFFHNQVGESVEESLFNNTFEKAIFYLVDRILSAEEKGVYFIEVPMRELGTVNTNQNYSGLCDSVINATGKYIYDCNWNNPYTPLNINDLFCRIYKKQNQIKILVKNKNGSRQLFQDGSRAAYLEDIGANRPKLLSMDEFEYNNQNGYRKIGDFLDWLTKIRRERKIINGIDKKILIIGHNELTKTDCGVPCCIAGMNGDFQNTTPMEPFICLTVDGKRVSEMVRSRKFSAVICLGDRKYREVAGDEWMITNNYFDKIIYVGSSKPVSNAIEFYSFAASEIHSWYGGVIREPAEEVKCDHELLQRISEYIKIVRQLTEGGRSFRVPLNYILDYTFPLNLNDDDFEKLIDRFDEYLSINLVADNEGTREQLLNAYKHILSWINNNGNTAKIVFVNQLLQLNRKNHYYLVMSHEIDTLLSLNVPDNNIISSKAFKKALKHLSNNNLNKPGNKFFFLSSGNLFDILQYMNSMTILGEKIIITGNCNDNDINSYNDIRIRQSVNRLKQADKDFLRKENRMLVTGIEYHDADQVVPVILDDFDGGDNFLSFVSTSFSPDLYNVEFDDGSYENLSGSVLNCSDNLLWSLSDLSIEAEGLTITYYRNDDKIFERIWRAYYPVLHEEINECIEIWKKALTGLGDAYPSKKDLYNSLCDHGWKTSYNNFSNLLRDDNDTQFPRLSSLTAIRNLAGPQSEIHMRFNDIRRAVRASSLRKDLGRKLSETLYDLYIDINFSSDFVSAINEVNHELLNEALDRCLVKSKNVISIHKL